MDQPTQSTFWIGLTFDYPAYEALPAYPGLSYPAGRGLCVDLDGSMAVLRRPDGGHTLVPTAETRHVAEVPRVEPGEIKYETCVLYHDVGGQYKPINGWNVVSVTPVGPTRGTGTGGINQVAIILRRQVTS